MKVTVIALDIPYLFYESLTYKSYVPAATAVKLIVPVVNAILASLVRYPKALD